jgi:hypothetical protein
MILSTQYDRQAAKPRLVISVGEWMGRRSVILGINAIANKAWRAWQILAWGLGLPGPAYVDEACGP